jgi:hypothetical protein
LDSEFSFWNQIDKRIDSLESGLPSELLQVITTEIKNNPVSNVSYLTPEDYEREERTKGYNINYLSGVTFQGEDDQDDEPVTPIMFEQARSLTGRIVGNVDLERIGFEEEPIGYNDSPTESVPFMGGGERHMEASALVGHEDNPLETITPIAGLSRGLL